MSSRIIQSIATPATEPAAKPSSGPAWGSPGSGLAGDELVWPHGDRDSDEPPLESSLHLQQMLLLLKCLDWLWRDRSDYFSAGNLTVYYSPRQLKSEDFRGPDFFIVLDSDPRPRKSWVVWEEGGKYPNLIIELLSDSTAATDRGLKKQIYQDIFRTPDYFWFDPQTLEFAGFHLVDGTYRPLEPNPQGRLWSQQLGLFLGLYPALSPGLSPDLAPDTESQTLRFFTAEGDLVPTPEEAALAAQQATEAERQRADAEQRHNQVLLAQLRALGVEPQAGP
ncbi:MAG: Uma2 family endonuclease [Synechococcales cyanobacterium RM1_1_8]|nr:Uma2 family endonuclease [Synechococcales cyanobacterium RM1_1_8]